MLARWGHGGGSRGPLLLVLGLVGPHAHPVRLLWVLQCPTVTGGAIPGVLAACGVPPQTTAPPGLQLGISRDL